MPFCCVPNVYPDWRRRNLQCLRAASELARQANDTSLIAEVASEIDCHPRNYGLNVARPLGEELLAEVLKREREASSSPKSMDEANRAVVAIDGPSRHRGFDGSNVTGDEDGSDDVFDSDDAEDDDDDEDGPVFGRGGGRINFPGLPNGIPASAIPILLKIGEKYGRLMTPR